MSGVAVEDLLGLWSDELRGAKARLRPLFLQAGTAASAGAFLDGLLGPERKTGWMRAEAAGDTGPSTAYRRPMRSSTSLAAAPL